MITSGINAAKGRFIWELIERKEFTNSTNNWTFSNLKGDSTEEFLLRGWLNCDSVAGGNVCYFQLNGDTTSNYRTHYHVTRADSTHSVTTASVGSVSLVEYQESGTANQKYFEGTLLTKSGKIRIYMGTGMSRGTTRVERYMQSNEWGNTADEITSLKVTNTTNASGWLELYRKVL
jgi:hypothetical protein